MWSLEQNKTNLSPCYICQFLCPTLDLFIKNFQGEEQQAIF